MHFVEMQSTVDSETAASVDLEALPSANDTRGKHRILADLKLLDEESRFLEKELEEVEETRTVSTICQELLRTMISMPDPLLPLTNGPANASWDRWFEGNLDSQECRCLIL